jgi:UDP-N-acetylmuramoyl-tripeptide--D-alanyl-D-alanine ligase
VELWTWSELSQLGSASKRNGPEISGICIDSRQVMKGDLFVALSGDPGPRFHSSVDNPRDGHEFIPLAIKGGANAVMLSDRTSEHTYPNIQVSDTLDGLWSIGEAAALRCPGKRIAITGSAGKTTLRSWLMQVLAGQFKLHGSVGSLNNHWGVPLSLSRMPRDSELGIFEIGTNHSGEISPLSCLVRPHISVLLNVLPAHIGNFSSLAALEKEKRSIADGLETGGCLILPEHLSSHNDREITFGLSATADVHGRYEFHKDGWQVFAQVQGEPVEYLLHLTGEHRVLTSLALLAVAKQLGADLEIVAASLSDIAVPKGRGDETQLSGITIIDDSYNANPVSMAYAISALREKPGRRIAILGEINELGNTALSYHQDIALLFGDLDQVMTVGSGFAGCPGDVHYESASDIDLVSLAASLYPGDFVLIKGSNTVFWTQDFTKKLCVTIESKK